MLYSISKLLDLALAAKKFPLHVHFGPEATESLNGARERIVMWQPLDEKKEQFPATRSARYNPKMPMRREQAGRIRIYAKSPLPGAKWGDHVERCEKILDGVLAELDAIIRGGRNEWSLTSGGFISLVDEKGSPVFSSAVYELEFTVDRAVNSVNWNGDGADEVTIGNDPGQVPIVNEAEISGPNGVAETAFQFPAEAQEQE